MRLYLTGPMTGFSEMNFPAFHEASERLRAAGHEVKNPADNGMGDPNKTWADYVRVDLLDMLTCEGLAQLPGWEHSRGARLEHHVAVELEWPVKSVEEWLAC